MRFAFFLQTNNDRYTFIPTASISIIDGDFIDSNTGSTQRNANVSFNLLNPEFEFLI